MNIGIVKRLGFWRKNASTTQLGVYITQNAVWVFKGATEDHPAIEKQYPFQNKDWPQVFATIYSDFGPTKLQIVLGEAWYQLSIVDKPKVEANEIAQALVWSIKDMVSIPIDDLNLEYYDTPVVNRNKITLVVTNKAELRPLVEAIYSNHGIIAGLTIEQLALCNLDTIPFHAHLVISHYGDQNVLFTMMKDGKQYMQRRSRGFNDLQTIDEDDLANNKLDNLILELRRSMDFFESQLRQPPLQQIDLLIDGASQHIAKLLAEHFIQPINIIDKSSSVGAKMAALVYENFKREQS